MPKSWFSVKKFSPKIHLVYVMTTLLQDAARIQLHQLAAFKNWKNSLYACFSLTMNTE